MKHSMKSAVLAITLAAASINAATLKGNVPVVFQTGNQMHPAGAYEVAHKGAGIVSIKTANGAAVGIRMMSVQTEDERTVKNSLTFTRDAKGNFQFAGYCVAGVGCWANGASQPSSSSNKIEVAMFSSK